MAKAKRKGRPRARRSVSVAPMPFNGDHGTKTTAAMDGTMLVPIADSPNKMARRQRVDVYKRLNLTMRQAQAAKAIRDAHCAVESLSSGGPLKERVQASPKPDQTIDIQVGAQSRLVHVMRAVPRSCRHIVEHVLWGNKPLRALKEDRARCAARLRDALDRVADHQCY